MTATSRMKLLVLLPVAVMTGCTNPIKRCPALDIDTFCQNAFPIRLAEDEHLDDINADKLKAMDMYGMKHCGWKIR